MTMSPPATKRSRPATTAEVLNRYPRLTAHLVCESLGYFSPMSAARAILDHIQNRTNACEWYLDMARNGRTLLQVNTDTIARAAKRRRFHQGYMAHYPTARRLVALEQEDLSPAVLGSW